MWRRIALITGVLLLTLGPTVISARTITVANDGGADFRTIQAGIDAAVDGDTVLVRPGTYTGDGNRDLDFKGKAITVKSESGPKTCIIDCQGSRDEYHRGVAFTHGEDANSVLEGFTITKGYTKDGGAGILCESSSPSIRGCIIAGNRAQNAGVGVRLIASDSQIENCIISGNCIVSPIWGAGVGGGVSCTGVAGRNAYPVLRNCTIVGNKATFAGGVICGDRGTTCIENCIITGNTVDWSADEPKGTQVYGYGCMGIVACMDVDIRNCAVGDAANAVHVGAWSVSYRSHPPVADYIQVDPEFADPGRWDSNGTPGVGDDFWVQGDYHLKSQAGRWDPIGNGWVKDDVTSPCIDAGDPNDPVGEEPEPNGGRINMGAYGGTAEASMSFEPVIGPTPGAWSEPTPLAEINTTTAEEWSPSLSGDGLTIYFGRVNEPRFPGGRILAATRSQRSAHFDAPAPVAGEINRPGAYVLCPWISPGGRRLYYTHQSGSDFHLMLSELGMPDRAGRQPGWPVGQDIWTLNFLDDRLHTARLTPDELTILFTGPDNREIEWQYDIWMATRTDSDGLFSEPVNLTNVNVTPANDIHASISTDGLTLYFASDRNGRYQLFKSTRQDARHEFTSPVPMPLFDSPGAESMFPCLSPDGREFYFMRQNLGDRSTRDIYVSYRID